jgi:hypothetical protein
MSREGIVRAKFGELLKSRDERLPNDGTHPLYSLTIKDGVTPKTERYEREFLVTNKESKKYKVIRTGDLVFNPSNLRWGAIATSFIQFPVLASPIYEVFYPKDDQVLDPYFLGALASSPILMARYLALVEGTLVERTALKKDDFLEIEIEIPPLPEQKKIAEILSGIDQVIASKQSRVRSSQLLKKALITRHIENIEHGTNEAKLGDLLHSIDSGWSPDCLKRPPLSDSEWSILKTTSVTWTGFDQQERKALPSNLSPKEELVVEAGDILITRAGPADRTGVVAYADKKAVNTMISDKIIRLRCDTSTIEPRFLSIFLGTDYAQRQMLKGKVGMASSQTNISQQLLRDMTIRFPPLQEQMRISEIVAELQKTINQIREYIGHTEKLKASISSDLLSGLKRVSI